MKILLIFLLTLGVISCHAQTIDTFSVPIDAISKLEDVKELTKAIAGSKEAGDKIQAEARPEINRLLVISADDFLRIITDGKSSKEAYLACLDYELARLAPLTTNAQDRQQVANFFQDLMEIVGVDSSEGRLTAFATSLKK